MGRRSRVSKAMALLVGLTWLTVAGVQASWAQETQSSEYRCASFIDIASGD